MKRWGEKESTGTMCWFTTKERGEKKSDKKVNMSDEGKKGPIRNRKECFGVGKACTAKKQVGKFEKFKILGTKG